MRAGEASGGGVEVRDHLLQVLRHPLQLTVQVFCQLSIKRGESCKKRKKVITETKMSAHVKMAGNFDPRKIH
jgi:hypothetical protein